MSASESFGEFQLEPGPWFSLSWGAKSLRWLRFQPLHKARMLGWWLKGTVEWYVRWRWLPQRDPGSAWCNRITGEGDAVCPWCQWQFTLGTDAKRLERYYRLQHMEASQ